MRLGDVRFDARAGGSGSATVFLEKTGNGDRRQVALS